jgi:hypothetical protein
MLVLLMVVMVVPVVAADYYVYANKHGQAVVLDYVPVGGWTVIDGPFASEDAARRTWGIGDRINVTKPLRADPADLMVSGK